jgi:SAM-dependent methyltransferase
MPIMLAFKEYLRQSRLQLEHELGTDPRRRWFSPAYYSQYRVTLPLIKKYARGTLIDLGAGSMPYRQFIEARVTRYDSLEHTASETPATFIGDVQDMQMIPSQSYDTALCLEVLEHVPNPLLAVREVFRVLRESGLFIVSVPHLSRLHMEPQDYYRFTRYGIKYMLEAVGFQVVRLEKRGGLFSFVGNQVATVVLGLTWRIPLVGGIAWLLNRWLVTSMCYELDAVFDPSGVFAMGYTAVACKGKSDGRLH